MIPGWSKLAITAFYGADSVAPVTPRPRFSPPLSAILQIEDSLGLKRIVLVPARAEARP